MMRKLTDEHIAALAARNLPERRLVEIFAGPNKGVWDITPDKTEQPTLVFTDDDIIGG